MSPVAGQREIVDRRAVGALLEGADREGVALILKQALADGRAEIARRLADKPYAGSEAAHAYAFLTDQILRLAYDWVTTRLHPLANPTTSERLLLMGVGGYGRGEMALHSDVDISLVTPWKPTGWTETAIEALLYLLWDLGLKVGHSTRSFGAHGRRGVHGSLGPVLVWTSLTSLVEDSGSRGTRSGHTRQTKDQRGGEFSAAPQAW